MTVPAEKLADLRAFISPDTSEGHQAKGREKCRLPEWSNIFSDFYQNGKPLEVSEKRRNSDALDDTVQERWAGGGVPGGRWQAGCRWGGLLAAKKKGKAGALSRLLAGSAEEGTAQGCAPSPALRRPLVFQAQLAHGSATARLDPFATIQQLYANIARAFHIHPSQILFCTLNTPKINMEKLLGSQIGLEDFIFAHVKGLKKEVSIYKSEGSLGCTITDNGVGCAFIKRIREGSLVDATKTICEGDHIDSINGKSIVGLRHFEVAKILKELEKDQTFTLKLIEPKKAFEIEPRAMDGNSSGGKISNGRGTLRLRSKGPATVEELLSETEEKAIKKLDDLLEIYLGIRDIELAATMFEAGKGKKNPDEFAVALDEVVGDFAFPDEFVFDVWGVIGDAKQGRLQ
ncbi:PDZ domain-containing protein GIPC2 [Tachyglossus aculeatus]|uniref:PDZ domain-containing protein GIPC2 n=1 Tax=Tachyglossus aculeatus TaxID=9261 RepID=UPI0018F3BF91|nr:PDZ domain-containing protein GIPC2 [Tachyglossus aculeatus]